ncbi:MAG: ABC transporter ATP-binding protein, partial [Bacilli bacterium]|nr:ABC transporter ATP-binding protein [Bacilli bacterium]
MFELLKLIKEYPGVKGGQPLVALSVDYLSLPNTGMVFVVGKSGSGKSTLLHLLGGLDKPSKGDLMIGGKNSRELSEKDLDSYRNSCVGFVFQDFGLISEFTVGQNIGFALELQGRKSDKELISRVLDSLGLSGFADRHIDTLSGGQKQRVAIARALIKNPSVILADEPTGALDDESGNGVLSILKELSEEKLVVVVSHDLEAAKKYADRIIELKDGRVAKDTLVGKSDSIDKERVGIKLYRSRVPFHRGFKIGISAAIHKPLKLFACSMLVAFALSFFGLVTTMTFFDDARARTGVATTMHCESDLFEKNAIITAIKSEYDYMSGNSVKTEKTTETIGVMTSEEDITRLNANSTTGLDFAGVYGKDLYSFQYKNSEGFEDPIPTDQLRSFPSFSGFIDCGEQYLARNGMPMLCGTYPVSSNEIALSKYHSDILLSANPALFGDDVKNLIGTELSIDFKNYGLSQDECLFTVSGVVDTGDINRYYLDRYENSNHMLDSRDREMLAEYLRGSFHCLGYVSPSFSSALSSVFHKDFSSIYSHEGVFFGGISLSEIESNLRPAADDSLSFVLPKYSDMEQYSFFSLDGSEISYQDLARNEVYVDGSHYEIEVYSRLKNFLASAFACIHSAAFDHKMLPEADEYFADSENLNFFNRAEALFRNGDLDSFERAMKTTGFASKIALVVDDFAKPSFEREYVKFVLQSMRSLNASGNFNNQDLDLHSEFMTRYGVKVANCGISEEFDLDAFNGCHEYIRSHQSLRLFARKALCYALFFSIDKARYYSDIYDRISLIVEGGKGASISQN